MLAAIFKQTFQHIGRDQKYWHGTFYLRFCQQSAKTTASFERTFIRGRCTLKIQFVSRSVWHHNKANPSAFIEI